MNYTPPKPEEYSMLGLALLILNDSCPPDNTKYLCRKGEECENDCLRCWEKYLYWAANGYRGDPYRYDKITEGIEG